MVSDNDKNQHVLNRSVEAPIEGVYRYELIPAETSMDYYIDLWYQFGMADPESLLENTHDYVYLNKGDVVIIQDNIVTVRKKESHLKLVVNNDSN